MKPAPVSYDVVVIGAGVVGAAIARALAHTPLRVALVDAQPDIGAGTTKANTAILHTGFDAAPRTLESRLVRRGCELLRRYAVAAGIPVEPLGALVVAWDGEQLEALPGIARKAEDNGIVDTRPIAAGELLAMEPRLGPGALGALHVPGESIICPWTTPLAFATQAVEAGVQLLLETRVTAIQAPRREGQNHVVTTDRGVFGAGWVVNAAGLWSDEIDRLLGHDRFTVTPRRGELIVFDKLARRLVGHILLPVPTGRTKGVLVTPTVFGNVLLGPTAEDLDDKTATGSSAAGLAQLQSRGSAIVPALLEEEVTAVYAGLRAATEHDDYVIELDREQRYVCVGGIRSTGLSASMAIAEHVVELLGEGGIELGRERDLEVPRMPNIGEASPRTYRRADLIEQDSAYGEIVCHCEQVTRGEVRDGLVSAIPARDVPGLKRRTRVTMGRCQGFYCGAAIDAMLESAGR